jgi:hypothetical protein
MVYHLTYSIVIRLYQHILKIIEEQYKINVIHKEMNVTKVELIILGSIRRTPKTCFHKFPITIIITIKYMDSNSLSYQL